MSSSRIPVAIVGATGLAGQQFLASLAGHPLFEVRKLAASSRSAGKKYADAVKDDKGASKWFCSEPLSAEHAGIMVEDSAAHDHRRRRGWCSPPSRPTWPASSSRAAPPPSRSSRPRARSATSPTCRCFCPGVNWDHAALIDVQRKKRGWKGFITPGPNCTTVGLAMTLRAARRRLRRSTVIMTSMQALSGAGRSPGVSAMDILDNIVPYIPKEEEKVETETHKILGKLQRRRDHPRRRSRCRAPARASTSWRGTPNRCSSS